MSLEAAVATLKATADPTRLRLLALIAAGEAMVSELVTVLGQSQPRVSRHLRLLCEARLASHFRDGQCVYYRLDPAPAQAAAAAEILALARLRDRQLAADQSRMAEVRGRREQDALGDRRRTPSWAGQPGDRPGEAALAQALDNALGSGALGDVLDVGVGTGTLLRLLAPRARRAVGLDTARGMRVLARSRLQRAGLAHCTIRAGDVHSLPFPDLSFDVVVLDEVLNVAGSPQAALAEAARVLCPAGRLLVLDRILPAALKLTAQSPGPALFDNQLAVMLREAGLRPCGREWFPGRSLQYALVVALPASARARTGTDG